MVVIVEPQEGGWTKINDKIRRKIFYAGNLMFILYEMDPGAEFPLHSHPEEQAGFIIQGEVEVHFNGQSRTLKAGSWYYFAPNELHGGRVVGSQKALVIDVFTPPKKELVK